MFQKKDSLIHNIVLLSQTCNHAIRATLYLAMQPADRYVTVREVSERIKASPHFLTKILQMLTARGILQSFRGPNGGVKLARPARAIRLIDIVEAIDGRAVFEACLLGLAGCGERTPCPIHDRWSAVRERIQGIFESATLEGVARDIEKKGLRLANLELDHPPDSGRSDVR